MFSYSEVAYRYTLSATWGLWRAFKHRPFSTCYFHPVKWLSPGPLPWTPAAVCGWKYHRRVLGPEGEGSRGNQPWEAGTHKAIDLYRKYLWTVVVKAAMQKGCQDPPWSDVFLGLWGEKTANQISNQKKQQIFGDDVHQHYRWHNATVQRDYWIAWGWFFPSNSQNP